MMKEGNTDKIKSTVTEYLRHRCYEININMKDNCDLLRNEDFLSGECKVGLKEIVSPSSPNSFTFSTTSSQYNFIDQQYIRLKTWMTEASEPCRSELSQILFPFFVHLYLDLLMGAGKQAAKFFFSRHHQVFRVNRDYEQTLKQVWSAAGETGSSSVIQNLKSGKYLVRLSEVTLNYFLKYLQASNNPTLLQIFNNFLEIEITDSAGGNVSNTNMRAESAEEKNMSPMDSSSEQRDCTVNDVSHIDQVIKNVRNSKPLMPSLAVYDIHNAYNGLTCSKINSDSRLLVSGFEDSVIKLWRLVAPSQYESSCEESGMYPMLKKNPDMVLFCDSLSANEDQEKIDAVEKEDDEEEETKGFGGRYISGGELCTLRGHKGSVYDVAFTHCSSYLLSVGDDSVMRLWDIDGQRILVHYYGHHYPIWSLDVSQHSFYIATGSNDETVRLWSTEFTHPLRTFVGHCGSVDSVAFHPNCNYVASGSSDKSIRLWQVNDASVARVLVHHDDSIKTMKFSHNGKYLASGSESGEVLIWDLSAGKVLHEISPHYRADQGSSLSSSSCISSPIISVDWSKDSRVLYSASSDGVVKATYLKNVESNDITDIGSIICQRNGNAFTLIHASLNSHNYLQAVMVMHGER